jgi:hypothetical protein
MAKLLAAYPHGRCRYADPTAAGRAEHALAWMFGLEANPTPTSAAGATGQSSSSAPGTED